MNSTEAGLQPRLSRSILLSQAVESGLLEYTWLETRSTVHRMQADPLEGSCGDGPRDSPWDSARKCRAFLVRGALSGMAECGHPGQNHANRLKEIVLVEAGILPSINSGYLPGRR